MSSSTQGTSDCKDSLDGKADLRKELVHAGFEALASILFSDVCGLWQLLGTNDLHAIHDIHDIHRGDEDNFDLVLSTPLRLALEEIKGLASIRGD